MKKKLVFIASHLSTGGMPQYLLKQIQAVQDDFEVFCIEWQDVTGGRFIVQRNQIQQLLGNRFTSLSENKEELFSVLNTIGPDIIHLQELPEHFMPYDMAYQLYYGERKYTIFETPHSSTFSAQDKKFLPDKFLLASAFHITVCEQLRVPYAIIEYPIELVTVKNKQSALNKLGLDPSKKHIINVGLFTPGKNQSEAIHYARLLKNYPFQFHFIGNQADNFREYWEPLMRDFPPNCTWWGERDDVSTFYEMADLFLFTSKVELMPLVVREAISWGVPSLIYNLPSYVGQFDKYDVIEYLGNNVQQNAYRIAEKVLPSGTSVVLHEKVYHTMQGEEYLESLRYFNSSNENYLKYGDAAGQYYATFKLRELEHGDIKIRDGDVFVDIGANIGMSSTFATLCGAQEVHCFEPDSEMIKLLKKNVPTAIVHQYAIADTQQRIELYHWPYNPNNVGPTYTVQAITLQDVLRIVGKRINYLKIDIEGFEETMFDNISANECAQIDQMMIEYHRPDTTDSFCAKLREKGFDIIFVEYGYQSRIYAKYHVKEL